jgi:hypothetical protein
MTRRIVYPTVTDRTAILILSKDDFRVELYTLHPKELIS